MKTDAPDISTMRDSASRALIDAPPTDELDTLALTLRGHIEVLIPDVEVLVGRQPKGSIPAAAAIACTREARRKLRIGNGKTLPARVAVAQKLARCVNALCTHFEKLGGEQP